jgi:ferrochelatase
MIENIENIEDIDISNFNENRSVLNFKKRKTALLLLNMGGPNNLSEVPVFLTNMFNDKNIITVKSDLLRKFIATMIVLSRKNVATENYRQLGGKSPIIKNTQNLVKKLQELEVFSQVKYVMRYTPPFAEDVLLDLKNDGIESLILFPMYPQYSTTTTLSSFESINEAIAKLKWYDVNTFFIKPYYNDYLYNQQIVNSITEKLITENCSLNDVHLIFSAHGLPQKIVDKGDPYVDHLNAQMEMLSNIFQKEKIDFASVELSYQSKVGPMKWLEPSLETTLKKHKDHNVVIYPISFTVDNSETDLELDVEYREVAEEIGINKYIVIKALNAQDGFIQSITEIINSTCNNIKV